MLAALTLLVITVIMIKKRAAVWNILLPFLLMITISSWALIDLFLENLRIKQWPLLTATAFLIVLSISMIVLAVSKVTEWHKNRKRAQLIRKIAGSVLCRELE